MSLRPGKLRLFRIPLLGATAVAFALMTFGIAALAQSDEQITRAQQILSGLGYYNGRVDGVSGPGTQAAIQRFQDENGITPTGRIDDYTWGILQQRASGASSSSSSAGAGNNDIADAQIILTSLGYDPGPVDGAMGSKTRNALQAFQRSVGLVSNGQLNPETLAALRSRTAGTSQSAGESGDPELREAQQLLTLLGYGELDIDGRTGPATSSAIAAFQRAEGLNRNGRLTPATLDRLRLRAPHENTQTDPMVADAQAWLKLLGYDVSTSDGVMGPETVRAVSRFQADENLRRTGTITPETFERLRARARDVTDIPRENPFIEEAQRLLAEAGFDPGPADGMSGGRTESAMREFQQAEGLRITGTLTLETLNALRGEDNAATEIMDFWSLQRAQQLLRELGYLSAAADGVLGPATATALARFQAANGISTSGGLTVETYNLLEEQRASHRSTVQNIAMEFWAFQFADYSVQEIYSGESAPLIVDSHPMMARADPFDLAAQYEVRPNFAGHYVILQVNMLSGIAPLGIVIDVTTGAAVGTVSSSYGIEYRPDSRLIVADPIDTPDVVEEVERGLRVQSTYYLMDQDGQLSELRGDS